MSNKKETESVTKKTTHQKRAREFNLKREMENGQGVLTRRHQYNQ